jgi:UrcA family protein
MKGTCLRRLATGLSAVVLATAGLPLTSDFAFAQPSEQITIVPPFSSIRREHQTRHRIYLTRWVGYSDLDLRTDEGVQTLGARIGYVAQQNCRLLDRYYPDSTSPAAKASRKLSCITDAVYGAQPQVNAVISAARQ